MSLSRQSSGLLAVERAREELAACRDLHEVTEIRDKAKAMEAYQRAQRAGKAAMADAAAIRLLAERRAGQMLTDTVQHQGGRPEQPGQSGRVSKPRLADLGVSEKESKTWQKVASVPQQDFDRALEKSREEKKPVATSALLKLAAPSKKTAAKARTGVSRFTPPAPLMEPGARFSAVVVAADWESLGADGVRSLPVLDLAEPDCAVWLWCDASTLREAFRCLDAWGLTDVATIAWNRVNPARGARTPRRGIVRGVMDYCVLATRGDPRLRTVRCLDYIECTDHNHGKPVEFYRLVDQICPGSRVAMCATPRLAGWNSWQPTQQENERG